MLSSGTKIGPYEIVAPLGAGGMGEVYRARDARLNRDVAVKVLPASFAADADRLRRFEQEARATGMLNHPNILAVYDVGTHEGAPYLVTELLEGATLREQLPVPRRKALDYARQIAVGLAAAHTKGVTHRDLKPENLFITNDGRAKILDFGLAKVEAPEVDTAPTRTAGTTPGLALGTVGYMSPEQALGKAADHRSDIFAFGAILYEMLSGQRAFQRASGIETLNAILKEDPPPLAEAGLERVVGRCLEKSPEQRFQSASDLAFNLEALSGSMAAPAMVKGRTTPWTWIAAGATVMILAAGFAAGFWLRARQDTGAPTWTGVQLGGPQIAYGSRISPNGQTLAFAAMVDGQSQIAVMNPDSGNWSVLTHDRSKGIAITICWSHDSSKIYFDRGMDVPRGIFTVPALGGEEQLLLEDAAYPEVLPDGSLLLVRINAERKTQLHRFWPETSRLETLGAEVLVSNQPLRVFPDGHEAAFLGRPLASQQPTPEWGLYVIDLSSGATRRLAPGLIIPDSPMLAIAPGGHLVLVSTRSGDLNRVVEVPRDGRGPGRTVLALTTPTWSLDVGSDGSFYLDQVDRPFDALRFPSGGGRPETVASAPFGALPIQLTDGRILFAVRLAGRARLLVAKPGKDAVPLVQTGEETAAPFTVLGQQEVAFRTGKSNDPASWITTIASLSDGRIVRRLSATKGVETGAMSSSRDGKTIYYTSAGSVWSILSAGGEPRKLAAGDAVVANPNGQDLVVLRGEKEAVHLVRVPLAGGSEQPIPFNSPSRLAALPPNSVSGDGRILVSVLSPDSWWNEAAILEPRTGKVEKLKVSYAGDIFTPGWTPDGRILAGCARLQANLWRFRKEGK